MHISKKPLRILAISIVITFLVLGGAFAYRALHASGKFHGNLVKNPDHFRMDTSYFNGTEDCVLPLQKDQWLKVQMQVEKGEMTLRIADETSAPLYQGDGSACSEFLLAVPKTGNYSVALAGHRAKGRVEITALDAEE